MSKNDPTLVEFWSNDLSTLLVTVKNPLGINDEEQHKFLTSIVDDNGLAAVMLIGGVQTSDPIVEQPPPDPDPNDLFQQSIDEGSKIIKQFWAVSFSLGIQKSPALLEVVNAIKVANVDYLISIGALAEAAKAFLSIPLTPTMDPFLNQQVVTAYNALLSKAATSLVASNAAEAALAQLEALNA